MSKVCALYHIVISTKNREMTITNDYRRYAYEFIYKILREKRCFTHQIGGIPNHIHLLIDLHPSIALADLMREIKSRSSGWMKNKTEFPQFKGWGKEYFAATISFDSKDSVINYIKNQQQHHLGQDFNFELEDLCKKHDMLLLYDELT